MSLFSIDKIISFLVFIVSLVLIIFFGQYLNLELSLYIHIASFLGLGLLYELPELLLNIWSLRIGVSKRIIQIRYFLTHVLGPIFGVVTVISGFCLIHFANHSFLEGWIFWIVGVSAIFIANGLYHHNPYIRSVMALANSGADSMTLRKAMGNRFDLILNFLEFPAYIFIFWADYVKPPWFVPAKELFEQVEQMHLGNILIGVVYFISVFFISILMLRYGMMRWSICR